VRTAAPEATAALPLLAGCAPRTRLPAASECGFKTRKVLIVMNPSLIHIIHAGAYRAERTSRRRFRKAR